MRTYHVYRNGRPATTTVDTAGTPVWGGQPMLPWATTAQETVVGTLVAGGETTAGQGEARDEK